MKLYFTIKPMDIWPFLLRTYNDIYRISVFQKPKSLRLIEKKIGHFILDLKDFCIIIHTCSLNVWDGLKKRGVLRNMTCHNHCGLLLRS